MLLERILVIDRWQFIIPLGFFGRCIASAEKRHFSQHVTWFFFLLFLCYFLFLKKIVFYLILYFNLRALLIYQKNIYNSFLYVALKKQKTKKLFFVAYNFDSFFFLLHFTDVHTFILGVYNSNHVYYKQIFFFFFIFYFFPRKKIHTKTYILMLSY